MVQRGENYAIAGEGRIVYRYCVLLFLVGPFSINSCPVQLSAPAFLNSDRHLDNGLVLCKHAVSDLLFEAPYEFTDGRLSSANYYLRSALRGGSFGDNVSYYGRSNHER